MILEGGSTQSLLAYINAQLRGDLRNIFVGWTIDQLRREEPRRPIFYRKGPYTHSLPVDLHGLPVPEEYQTDPPRRFLYQVIQCLPPEAFPGLMAATIRELEIRIGSLPNKTDLGALVAAYNLELLRRVPTSWRKLDDIPVGLDFEPTASDISLFVLPANKPWNPLSALSSHTDIIAREERRRAFVAKANGRVVALVDSPESLEDLGEELLIPMKFMLVQLPNGSIDFRVGNSPLHREKEGEPSHYQVIEEGPDGSEVKKTEGTISFQRKSFYPTVDADSRAGWKHHDLLLTEHEEIIGGGTLVRAGGRLFVSGDSDDFLTEPRMVHSARAARDSGLLKVHGILSTLVGKHRVAHQIRMERGEVRVHLRRTGHANRKIRASSTSQLLAGGALMAKGVMEMPLLAKIGI